MRLGADVLELDLYAVLGVAEGASTDELRRAYRRKARESHPDLNPGDPNSARRMVHLNLAFRVLLDPALRGAYHHARRKRVAVAHQNRAAAHSAAWYERSAQGTEDWTPPITDEAAPGQRACHAEFLSQLRRSEARLLLRVLEGASAAKLSAQVAILATSIVVAAGLIGWAGVRSPQPTSVDPHALYP
jgi:curved DNA-binding protein CbpA